MRDRPIVARDRAERLIQLQREADRAEERYMWAPMRCALVAWLHAALVMPLTRSLSSPTPDEIVARVFERARLGQLEAQLPPVGLTPVGVSLGRTMIAGAGLATVSVEFCRVQFPEQKADPVRVPFHHNLVAASGCDQLAKRVSVEVEPLLAAVTSQEGGASHRWSGLPQGVVLHMARCGSTAVANMIAAAPRAVLLSEPGFIFEALVLGADGWLSSAELTVLLRLLAQLTTSGAAEILQVTSPQLFLKMQSNIPLIRPAAGEASSLISLQTAWPDAAWAFILRAPLEVAAAQLAVREGSSAVIEDAAVSERLALSRIPCLGSRAYPGPFIAAVLNEAGIMDLLPSAGPAALTAEAYCAAHIGALLRAALNFTMYLEERRQDCAGGIHVPTNSAPGCNSMMFIDHAQLTSAVLGKGGLFSHFGIRMTDRQRRNVLAIGHRNAKNSSVSAEIGYATDSHQKRRSASTAANMWTELLADPSFDAVRMYRCSRNGTHQRSDGDTCSQQLPSTEELSSTSSSDATNDGDAVPAINIALGQRMMSLVAPAAKCSYKPLPAGWPQLAFVHVAETAMKSFAEGDWDNAEACWWFALINYGAHPEYHGCTRSNTLGVLENLAVLEHTRSQSQGSFNGPRVWHGTSSEAREQIPLGPTLHDLAPFQAQADSLSGADGVALFASQLDKKACEDLIALFERSKDEHYLGNMLNNDGELHVNVTKKKTLEVDISRSARPEWIKWDQTLLKVLTSVLYKYEANYPGFTYLPNPLWDEGFRMKRYDPADGATAGLHDWHVDKTGNGCRELAFLVYLAEVPGGGGETLFRSPRPRAIVPRAGSVLVFPAAATHLHAGAPPVGGPKYVISNFLSTCSIGELLAT